MIFLGRELNNHSAPHDYLIPVPEKSFRMLDAAKIAPSQIDYPGIGGYHGGNLAKGCFMAHVDDQRVARVLDALEAQHPARSCS